MARRRPTAELSYLNRVVRRDGGTGVISEARPPKSSGTRGLIAALLGRPHVEFVCLSCTKWVAVARRLATPSGAADRAVADGVYLAELGPEDWRLDTFGPHRVCELCTGLFVDLGTPARPLKHGSLAEPRRRLQPPRKKKRGHEEKTRFDLLDVPGLVLPGSFEGGRRR